MKPILRITNWKEFQHYDPKKRDVVWIKNYLRLLRKYEYTTLPEVARAHLHGLWMLAGSYNGKLPFDPTWIASQISATSPINWAQLALLEWVELNESASALLADREHDDSLRALAREEKEEDPEKNPPVAPPAEARNEIPEEYAPSPEERKWARENHGLSESEITAETLRFVQHHRAKGNRFKRPGLAWKNWISGRFVGGHKGRGNGPILSAPLQTE